MVDVADRAASPGDEPVPAVEPRAEAASGAARRTEAPDVAPLHWTLAALLLGAGLIHAAMAPSHLAESGVEGAGFVAAAWCQLLLAVAVLRRPGRGVLLAVAAVSGALIVAWAVSRTAGLPFGAHSGHAASVSIVDGVAVGLEVAAVLLTGALATGALAARALPIRLPVRGLALAGALGAVALATAAVSSPSARDHAAGSHGADGGHGTAGHEDASMAGGGHDHGGAHEGEADDLGFAALDNGHQHDHEPEPLTTDERVELAGQLAVTAELVELYPTVADAEAAGWTRAGPFSPGLGTHYSPPEYNPNPDGVMDTREDLLTPMLVFDGLAPDAPLAGFMYIAYGTDEVPEGFAGTHDMWHHHESVCIVQQEDGSIDTPFGADLEGVTEAMCTEAGGSFLDVTGYMVHVWNVPGYESPDGMFTELNPAITCPDGTYHQIPIEELGTKRSTCQNP